MENGLHRSRGISETSNRKSKIAKWDEDVDFTPGPDGESEKTTKATSLHQQQPKRKLVLHFDVRNTVLVADSVTNINVEQALNSYLTGVTWGRDTPEGWEWYSDRPSLKAPAPGWITYYKHLEQRLVRVPSDRGTLRRVLGDFTQEKIGEKFQHYFHKHLQFLEWHHGGTDMKLTLAGREGKLFHYMLPSFFKMIKDLQERN